MAITASEGRTFLARLLVEFGEDYHACGRILRQLRVAFPGIDWDTELSGRATASAAFQASGLSIAWWVAEVIRLSRL